MSHGFAFQYTCKFNSFQIIIDWIATFCRLYSGNVGISIKISFGFIVWIQPLDSNITISDIATLCRCDKQCCNIKTQRFRSMQHYWATGNVPLSSFWRFDVTTWIMEWYSNSYVIITCRRFRSTRRYRASVALSSSADPGLIVVVVPTRRPLVRVRVVARLWIVSVSKKVFINRSFSA